MILFIKNILIFLAIPIIIAIAFEASLRLIPNSYSTKKSYLDKNSEEIEILILGSSHAADGINPKYINGSAYNAAMTSQSLDIDYAILKKYESHLNKLKYILLPIDYFSLTSRIENGIESWRLKDYIIYFDLPLISGFKNHFEITSRPIKINLDRFYSSYFMQNSELYYNILGNKDFKTRKKKHELNISARVAIERQTCNDFSYFKENIEILKKIIHFSSNRNIELILYTSPGFITYTSLMNSNQMNMTINAVKELDKLNPCCIYFNFLNDSSFKEPDFSDGDHLNELGSKKLSLTLNEIIKQNEKPNTISQ